MRIKGFAVKKDRESKIKTEKEKIDKISVINKHIHKIPVEKTVILLYIIGNKINWRFFIYEKNTFSFMYCVGTH